MARQFIYHMSGLNKSYGTKKVLENVNLSFYPDAKIGILGPNGAGKSTVLRIMAGLDKEFTGEAWVAEGATVGYLAQEPQLDPTKNVAARWIAHEDGAGTLRGTLGAYEVLALLGRGGMGEVYLAHDTRLDRNVAVKLLRPDLTSNPDAVRRFEQEARAASSLNHPNIVTIYEIGELEDRRFLAMEFVDGRSLDAMLGGPVDISSIAQIGAQLAQALAVAHAAGIVHRDIKPENIMVREDGYVKLLDFGVARLLSAPAAGEARRTMSGTSPGLILGTPRYMSPEQARGETAMGASDMFSLGVVLYELATGTHPFEAESALGMLHTVASRATPKPARGMPRPPAFLERLLRRMLERRANGAPLCE